MYGYSYASDAGHFDSPCYAASFVTPTSPVVRIDHPSAPATKVLAHAAVLSDEQKLVCDETVTSDATRANGRTAGLVRRAQQRAAPLAHGHRQLCPGDGQVEGKQPPLRYRHHRTWVEVCWQISGIRADANADPLWVETVKTDTAKGKYLNPIELGQPESEGRP